MTGENDLIGGYMALIDDHGPGATFLRSTPWILNALAQNPDSLIRALRYEAGRLKELPRQPRFSLLAVLRDTWPQHLSELIASARCQSYQDWELVLVDDGSTSRGHLEIARHWADRDHRIRLRSLGASRGLVRALNLAVEGSTGDYVIVTDGDGVLHPMVLGIFARRINDDPKVNFVFANEAKIDADSTELTNFILKPPFDLFTLLRVSYVGRLYAVGRDLLDDATRGGPAFRGEYEGIEEHDLLLRLALSAGFESRHAALFTYYRRARSHGLARVTDEELVARRRRLVEEFVPRVYPGSSWSSKVGNDRDPLASTSIWLTDVPDSASPKLLIVIPFKDEVETTILCLESIERQEHRLDVVVALVNNRSREPATLPRLRSWIDRPRRSRHEILDHDCAFNFAKLNNAAVARLGGDRDLILLLNNDVELTTPQALQTMAMQLLADRSIGFIGIKLYYPGGIEIQHGGVRVGKYLCGPGYNQIIHSRSAAEFVDAERISLGVTFACAMTRRETFEKLGGLEEIYLPNTFGDVSMCLKALDAGYRNYYLGSVTGIHHESKSRGTADEDIEFTFLYERLGGVIASSRLLDLNRSYRFAWPLQVLDWNYPPLPAHELGSPAVAVRHVLDTNRAATISLPLRYRLADRLNGALKLGLGPIHGGLRWGIVQVARGCRTVREPRAVVDLGRRFLGPIPVFGTVGRKSVRLARRMKRRCQVAARVLSSVCRNPESARLLAVSLRHGGRHGLQQMIRILVPATTSETSSTTEWFERTRPSHRLLARLRRRPWPAEAPKFTVITPVYNVREDWLREAVGSVIAQTYPHWEMICINDHSSAPHVRPVLEDLSALDPRLRVIHCARNGGVSVATNLGLAEATGDYVAFMDHDDFLEPHALQRFAEVVLRDQPDMIYSDEAMTDVDIDRIGFVSSRPSFSYDHYLSHPYFVHLIAARTEIVRRVGGLNEEMSISQDVDLGLRLIEACREIAHVPEVLYRWRTHPGSLGHQQKYKVHSMTRGALERHFQRIGLDVEFDDESHFNFRDLRFAVPAPAHVAIIIPTKDEVHRLRSCIASLERTLPSDLAEIVIVDRGSEKPPTRSLVGDLARRYKVLRHEGASNLSAVLNRGAAAAGETATHYLFLHDDIEAIASGWLQHMLGYAQRADVGIVGATLLSPDETIQHAGAVIGLNGIVDHVLKRAPFRCSEQHRFGGPDGILLSSRDVSAVTDACLLVRADVFERLAGFDEGLTVRYHELDLCLRTRELEYKVIQDAYAVLYHAENQVALAGSAAPDWCDLQRFLTRHTATVLAGDLFFSPALSKTSTDMALVSAAQASKRPRWRTTRVVLPGSSKRSQSFRLDTASRSRPVAQPTRASVSAVLRAETSRRDGDSPT